MEVKIVDNSDIFKKATAEGIIAALDAIGLTAERHAKEKCPVDTGLLRNSITHAVSGEAPALKNYHATYGSNRYTKGKNAGKRISAGSKNAGDVGFGMYAGTMPEEPNGSKAVYIGTNVEYAEYVETRDSAHHNVGQAHFLRDAATTHGEEYKRIAEVNIKKHLPA